MLRQCLGLREDDAFLEGQRMHELFLRLFLHRYNSTLCPAA